MNIVRACVPQYTRKLCNKSKTATESSSVSDSFVIPRRYYTIPGTPGSGAGKGGGSGGAVRESGGGLGQYGAAQEEGYFFNKQRKQLEKIKKKLKKETQSTNEVSQKEEK
ncbi:ATPase inhibitor mai-1, mitochondrial-like [Achroia grisella]|uniref:ATPase inhibitor mai-1, mitochondrial-like n=1 Tax=Achroia grisella TaxID=688607 RepID=UPI0027D24534|nr:ATPase inhibitor mai-1, mitochondrial-like [Achroia grisella]